MSYRPCTDVWILARAKLKNNHSYYGSFPGGFPERARELLGVSINEPVLHVCSGMIKHYPYDGAFGPYDQTLDLDPTCKPDFLQDARDDFPKFTNASTPKRFKAVLIDPPYTPQDAEQYAPGADSYPTPNLLLRNALKSLRPGRKVGILHYIIPSPPSEKSVGFKTKFVAVVGVFTGYNNRIRAYSVFKRL